jgi:hypothetical protein
MVLFQRLARKEALLSGLLFYSRGARWLNDCKVIVRNKIKMGIAF